MLFSSSYFWCAVVTIKQKLKKKGLKLSTEIYRFLVFSWYPFIWNKPSFQTNALNRGTTMRTVKIKSQFYHSFWWNFQLFKCGHWMPHPTTKRRGQEETWGAKLCNLVHHFVMHCTHCGMPLVTSGWMSPVWCFLPFLCFV